MEKKYGLEIYHPDVAEDVLIFFESDTPFMQINKGDILNSLTWDTEVPNDKILRVVGIEHFLWEAGEVTKHKIGVITKLIENTEQERFK